MLLSYRINTFCSTTTTVNPSKAMKPSSKAQAPETPFIPPPSSLLHPTLLEKMRLDSPSSAHIQLSTLNRGQSNQVISETLYSLQDSAPFPRLPPYYVHKPRDSDAARTSGVGTESADGAEYTKARPTATGTRPPSGRSKILGAIILIIITFDKS